MTDKDTKEVDEERQGDENGEEKVNVDITGLVYQCMQVEKSPSNLAEVLHGGRPKDEEPHVKKSGKKKKEGEEDAVEYIVRVDLVGDELFAVLFNLPLPCPGKSWN